ncbi:MAG: M18 family aminopeptidase [Lachnospiraceae bacterium]
MISEFISFIKESKTTFHCIEEVKKCLKQHRVCEIKEKEELKLSKGETYYKVRNDSSIIAFKIPEGSIKGFHIVASHSDTPTFKVKENPEICVENQYNKLNVEGYGGMILSTWLDRPLSVAGRIVVKEKGELVSKLVDLKDVTCVIPNMAIHLNREMNKGIEYNKQIDMLPLFSMNKEDKIMDHVKEEVLGSDLYLYNIEEPRILGVNSEFLLAPRIDDMECIFASLKRFVEETSKEYVTVLAVFDNEEVGSRTRQGADSNFLESTLEEIMKHCDVIDKKEQLFANSFMVSADNAHGVHPNHPEKSDPTNRPFLNGGIVIKYHGGQQYTTDGFSAAYVKSICKEAAIPTQNFANRSDMVGGFTLGNVSIAHVSIPSVDIGLAQLAMHSSMETTGTKDLEYMVEFCKAFYKI